MELIFVLISGGILFLNLSFSHSTNNPLYVSGKSFIEGKIISKIFAAEFGERRNSRVPRNEAECLNEMVGIINEQNPDIYTGPDYLGAHAANRRVNALFPSRFWDADLVVADVFEAKTLGAFGDSGWIFNKEGLRRLTNMNKFEHIYSCGKVSAFSHGVNKDSAVFVDQSEVANYQSIPVDTKKISMDFKLVELPEVINKDDPAAIITAAAILNGTFKDKVSYWIFEEEGNKDNKLEFVNYASVSYDQSLDKAEQGQYVKETVYPKLGNLKNGIYKVYWGMGDLLDATDIYIGTVEVTSN